MTSIFAQDIINEPYDPFYDPCPYKKAIDEEISVLVDTKTFIKYIQDKENSIEYVVYRSIVENNGELFDEFYSYETHHDSFFKTALENGNIYAIERIYNSGYIKYYDQLDIIINILINLTVSKEDIREFTNKQKYIIDFLLDCLINDYGYTMKYEQFFLDIDNETIEHTTNEYEKIKYILYQQTKIIYKNCAQKCLERNTCKILEDKLFAHSSSILFKYLNRRGLRRGIQGIREIRK